MPNQLAKAAALASLAACSTVALCKTTSQPRNSQPDNRGTPGSPLVIRVEPDQTAEQEAARNSERDERESALKERELFLTLAIAAAAIFQAAAAGAQIWIYTRQSNLMAGSLEATRDSARAALLNAQAAMNADRAWMLVDEITGPDARGAGAPPTVAVKYTNIGNTPAFLLEGANRVRSIPAGEARPRTPAPFNEEEIRIAENEGLIIRQGGPYTFTDLSFPVDYLAAVHKGESELWVDGYVKFRDVFGRVQETWYCWKWHPKEFLNNRWQPEGPEAYNRVTYQYEDTKPRG